MNLPLFLTYQVAIIGNGFVAEITARTQMLGTIEGDTTWLYGVKPGAIAESGSDLDQAHARLRDTLRLKFIDFAQEAKTFASFKTRVEHFFDDTDVESVSEWNAAVIAIRASGDAARMGLPIVKAESEPFIKVAEKQPVELKPEMNVPPLDVDPKAAANVQLAAAA